MPCVHGVEYLFGVWGVVALSVEQEINSTLFSCHRLNRQCTMATQEKLHIGQMIKAVFDESGMSISEFARQIHLERTTVYSIFERPSIDSELLARISLVLNHNFLSEIEQYYGLAPKAPSLTLHLNDLSPEAAVLLADFLKTASAQ